MIAPQTNVQPQQTAIGCQAVEVDVAESRGGRMMTRGSWRKGSDGTYRGVVCDGEGVVWTCGHTHTNRELSSVRGRLLRKASAVDCGRQAEIQMTHNLPVVGLQGYRDADVEAIA